MPRLTKRFPKYSKHRASGQAVVTLDGTEHYLGPYGTRTSYLEYDRLIAEWLANGRRSPTPKDEGSRVAVMEVLAAYKRYAEGYYRKNGKVTAEVSAIISAMRIVKRLYGNEDAAAFGPLNALSVPLAAFGLVTPMVASAAMSLSSVSVIGNSLRLRGSKI